MLKDNTKGITLILVSALMACVGQLFWKLSAEYGLYILLLGFFCYGIGKANPMKVLRNILTS